MTTPSPGEIASLSWSRFHSRARMLAVFALALVPLDMLMRFLMGLRDFPLAMVTGLGMYGVPLVIVYLALAQLAPQVTMRQRISYATLAVVLTAGFAYVMLWGGALAEMVGLRTRISATVGIDQLQAWAIRLIESQGAELQGRPMAVVTVARHQPDYARLVPRAIRDMRPNSIKIYARRDGRKYVVVYFGHFEHPYSVSVGPPSLTFPAAEGRWPGAMLRWAPGVYGESMRFMWL